MKTPAHEAVAQRAKQIWQAQGCPSGRDTEFWFEAQHELAEASSKPHPDSAADENARRVREAKGATAFAERVTGELASESAIEYQISPPIPEQEAVRAALQKKDARAPILPGKSAPRAATPESGKPLWRQPHSS